MRERQSEVSITDRRYAPADSQDPIFLVEQSAQVDALDTGLVAYNRNLRPYRAPRRLLCNHRKPALQGECNYERIGWRLSWNVLQ